MNAAKSYTSPKTIALAESILEHIYRAQRSRMAGLPDAEYMTLSKLLRHYPAEEHRAVTEMVFSPVCVNWLNADLFQVEGCLLAIRFEHFGTIGSAIYGDDYVPLRAPVIEQPEPVKPSRLQRIVSFLKGK